MVTPQRRDYAARLREELHLNENQIEQFYELASNAYLYRSDLLRKLMDPRRDVDEECGYPKTKDGQTIDPKEFQDLYDREPVAARVVELWPSESWQVTPELFEDESADTITPFEQAWLDIGQAMRSSQIGAGTVAPTHCADHRAHPVWDYCRRADVQSGIGQYGLILLGINDNKDLREPLMPSQQNELTYLRVFSEAMVQITRLDSDATSPRFGMPDQYLVHFSNTDTQRSTHTGVVGTVTLSRHVHHSRVIHVADNLGSSEYLGVPRMLHPLNRLLDVRKVSGGGAEGYWAGAFPGLSLETHPELGGEVEVDKDALRDAIEQYLHRLQRFLALEGMTAKSLAPQAVDPTPWLDALITQVCIVIDVPKRVFFGSERGELASSQDQKRWNKRVMGRQTNYLTPSLICPLVDRMIWAGILPVPTLGYRVHWPALTLQTEQEKADVAIKLSQALATYVSSGAEALLAPLEFLTLVLGLEEDEALNALEDAMGRAKQVDAEGGTDEV